MLLLLPRRIRRLGAGTPARRGGGELCPATPARARARPPRGPGPHPTVRGCCSRRGLATLWPSPRARCRPGFLTLGRRRTPAPLWAPAAPSPLGAPAPFKPSSQAPRHAPPAARVPYREPPAPSPSRRRPRPSARGRGQSGRLASPHETKKPPPPPPPREGKSRARARSPRPPPHAARAPAARSLASSPPPYGRLLSLPPPARPRARARPPFRSQRACAPARGLAEVGGTRESWRSRCSPPTQSGKVLLMRTGVFVLTLRPHAAEHAQSGRHCGGGCVGSRGCGGGVGGWDGTEWRRGLQGRVGRGALRPADEDPRPWCFLNVLDMLNTELVPGLQWYTGQTVSWS
ncbi:basic proline-rich protein-like isoform X1 [Leopardus geoffroyi]|uniref:basic proline-rich protein-like isoform X1 n=1 Tax=Leopardus geoffroyi TaxID=46844 RepID=UPI001E265233|nr:basic proline-rich protein-like isoform X1 [Leopardus geoffroyi]XP_045347897.1 basic proline-rich protein-like isoform X1 [Leopardus geoffroyi]XP_045347898.1 basic proline-rich protein-like isoform X1 [Leopardus geoffroyi]